MSADDARPGPTDAELAAALSAVRPPTDADDGWADSEAGRAALVAITDAASRAHRAHRARESRIRIPRRGRVSATARLRVAFVLAAVAVAVVALVLTQGPNRHRPTATGPGSPTVAGPRPAQLLLTGYDTCPDLLQGLRSHAAAQATSDGLPFPVGAMASQYGPNQPRLAIGGAPVAASGVPAHSGTTDQEAGADEPDTVKTDGRRILVVTRSTLHVLDAATHRQTGSLDLGAYTGSDSAQLLLSGDRALVLMGSVGYGGYGGAVYGPRPVRLAPLTATVLLVDLADRAPRVLSVFRPVGQLVDARLVGGTARLVVRSIPQLPLHRSSGRTAAARRADYAAQVHRATLSAWLPRWTVTTDGVSTAHTVPCSAVSHPQTFTGLSMLTVYSVRPAAGIGDVPPVSVAADGTTVYATTSSLYLASDTAPGRITDSTQLHRFDIRSAGAPVYLGSGVVPGTVAGSYSLSDWQGTLRVVTTRSGSHGVSTHSLYTLDAARLTVRGHLDGIGTGEDLHAVRFLGALGYVVTYQQVDPLFVLDLRDATHPRLAGRLTVTGFSAYLHDVGGNRLLGVGVATEPNPQEGGLARPVGVQVRLFDVHDPAAPASLARVERSAPVGDGGVDPHAFLYWAPTHLAAVPLPTTQGGDEGAVLLLRVGASSLTPVGTIVAPTFGDGLDVTRSLVVAGALWVVSDAGAVVTDLATLHRTATVHFG